jgi:hypothetical protein
MINIKVIFIAGQGRSGSTVIDSILGTLEGVSSFNEIYRLWEEGFVNNNVCPCGNRFKECEFWTAVVREAFGKKIDIEYVMNLHNNVDHSRHLLKIFTGIHGPEFKNKLNEYKKILKALYFALAKVGGKNIIVDSSKVPSRALILNQIPGIEIHAVHLVRDVHATVYAWKKKKPNPATGNALPQYSTVRSVFFWQVRNIFAELLAMKMPCKRILYEDFAKHPQETLQSLIDTLKPTMGKKLKFVDSKSINLGTSHSMGGNPRRFSSGVTRIQLDQEWMLKLDSRTRRIVTMMSFPLLSRYGYIGNR